MTQKMTPEESERCGAFVSVLQEKGLKAFCGPYWDGAGDHRAEPTFWYFHPLGNGGVGAYVTYDHGTYDQGFLEPGKLATILTALRALQEGPSREQIWAAMES